MHARVVPGAVVALIALTGAACGSAHQPPRQDGGRAAAGVTFTFCGTREALYGNPVRGAQAATLGPAALSAASAGGLPNPTGPDAVGVRHVGTVGAAQITAWYPARRHTGATAPYLAPGDAAALGGPAALAGVAPAAHALAAPLPSRQSRPVVLLQPGWGSLIELETTLAQDLASHGIIVLGAQPPRAAETAALPSGRACTARVSLFGGLGAWVRRHASLPGVGRLDPARLVLGGHSIGGAAALSYAVRPPPGVQGAFDLDGTLFGAAYRRPPSLPSLLVSTPGGGDTSVRRVPQRMRLIVLHGAGHFDLTDAPAIRAELGPLSSGLSPLLGTIGRAGTTDTVTLVRRFVLGVLRARLPTGAVLRRGIAAAGG